MKNIIKDCATCRDGETYDVARVILLVGSVALIAFTGISVWKSGAFDPSNFGIGLGSLLGGAGAGIGLKARTEPQGEDK